MDEVESSFLETQEMNSLVWCRYIDDASFIWTYGQEKLDLFLQELNIDVTLTLNFHMSQVKLVFIS